MNTKSWVVLDPENGFSCYETQEQAIEAAQKAIDGYLDDIEWADGVEGVRVAQITHCSSQVDRVERPEALDEYDNDDEGLPWNQDWAYRCNYQMQAVKPANGWIKVPEKLPKPWHTVLAHIVEGGLVVPGDQDSMIDAIYWSGNYWLQAVGEEDMPVIVTHWMPLPEAPNFGVDK